MHEPQLRTLERVCGAEEYTNVRGLNRAQTVVVLGAKAIAGDRVKVYAVIGDE